MEGFVRRLSELAGEGRVRQNEPMEKHTTFRIGGPADFFVAPDSVESLKGVLALCREHGMDHTVLGNGSNLLVRDGGYRGVVIALGGVGAGFSGCSVEGGCIRAGSGITLASLAKRAKEAGLSGLEFAAGIPGTLGGAVVMNAGAYGSEMKDVLAEVSVLDPQGQVRTLDVTELELGYRSSCIPKQGYLVLEAVVRLDSGSHQAISALMEELAYKRRSKQPLEYPSAGSTFKRPEGHYAGQLIEEAGLKGYRVGGAQVSEKHCGFVINRDKATCEDVLRLIQDVKDRVYRQFQVELEMEVKVLG